MHTAPTFTTRPEYGNRTTKTATLANGDTLEVRLPALAAQAARWTRIAADGRVVGTGTIYELGSVAERLDRALAGAALLDAGVCA